MNKRVIKFAASSLVLGLTTVGCSPAAHVSRPVAASAGKADQTARNHYEEAQKLLQKGKLAEAVTAMEEAVVWSPRDAGFRMGLAELYMKSGRFASAETTFGDVVALYPENHKASFYLALARIARGKTAEAMSQLQQMDPGVAPADVGLALAIAGDTRRAIELLEPAARGPQANGRVRQNLALAYALAGDWKKARVTASQDVSPADLGDRMTQWAQIADPSATGMRVAMLLNVKPVADDSGQPTRLALAPAAPVSAPVALAAAEPAPAPAVEAPVVAAAPIEAAPVLSAEAVPAVVPAAPEAAAQPSDIVRAQYEQAARSLVTPAVAERAPITATPIPAFAPTPRKLAAHTGRKGRFVVQIGAFRSQAQVERAWAQAQRRYGFGGAHEPLSTSVQINGLGRMHRLSVAGFDSQASAARLCQSIRSKSGACFVRAVAGDAPVQWASRYTRKA